MAYERKDNTGTQWVNPKKESSKHPDFTGVALIGGTEWRVASWYATDDSGDKKQDKSGNPYLNHKYSLPDPKYAKKEEVVTPTESVDADLPF